MMKKTDGRSRDMGQAAAKEKESAAGNQAWEKPHRPFYTTSASRSKSIQLRGSITQHIPETWRDLPGYNIR
jgi:hypothetical protein